MDTSIRQLAVAISLGLPLLTGCAQLRQFFFAAPAPLAKAPVQDAQAILLTADRPRPVPVPAPPTTAPTPPKPVVISQRAVPVAPPRPLALAPQSAAVQPQPVIVAPVPAAAVAAVPVADTAAAAAPPVMSVTTDQLRQVLEAWRRAWEQGDAQRYLGFYDTSYKGDQDSRGAWERQRAARLANGNIRVAIGAVRVNVRSDNEADVVFMQHYTSGRHSDLGEKRLKLKRDGRDWRIVQETWAAGGKGRVAMQPSFLAL